MRVFSLPVLAAFVSVASLLGTPAAQCAEGKPPAGKVRAETSGLFTDDRTGKIGARKLYLIPGLTAPGAAWDGVRPAFEPGFEVHTLSLAGFGGQPARPIAGSFLDAQADAIVERLRMEHVTGAVLVGHSLGGMLALLVAARAPEAVGKVIIVDSVPFLAQWMSGGAVQTLDQAAAMATTIAAQMGTGPWEAVVQRQRATLPIQSKDPAFQEKIVAWMQASDQASVAGAMQELLARDFRPQLPNVQQPVLVLMSYDEGFTPVPKDRWLGFAQAQYSGLAHGEVRLIEGSRHWIMHDQAQAFTDAVLAFGAN